MISSSRIPVLAMLLLIFSALSPQPVAAQQQSDYQIVRSYQSEYAAILNEIKTLNSVDEAEQLLNRINRVNNEYRGNANIINRYIFPEDLNSQITNLRDLTNASRSYLATVAEQGDEITRLNDRISELTSEIDRYNDETESLQNELADMTRSRNANRAVARDLRNRLAERDEFILGLVDSLFIAYDNLELSSLSSAEQEAFTLRADTDNVIGHIGTVVDNNISFIDTHTQLSSEDFLNLRAQYEAFEGAWSKLGNKLAGLYESGDEGVAQIEEVNDRMMTWKNRLDESVWRSLAASFENQGISLNSFDSSQTFYSALNSYIDDALGTLEEQGGSEEAKAEYENFADVWNKDVKTSWQEYIIDGRVLSYENVATIDRKLSSWSVASEPPAANYLLLAAGLGLLALILLVLFITKGSGSKKPEAAK